MTFTPGGSGGGGTGGVTFSRATSTLNATVGGSIAYDTISVSTTSPTSIYLTASSNITSCTTANWLSASLTNSTIASGQTANLNIAADPTGLPVGTCTGTVTVSPSAGAAASVSVTFQVGNSGVGALSVSPSTFTLNYTIGSSQYPAQALNITDSSPALVITVKSSPAWISFNLTQFAPGASITASLNAYVVGIAAGTYPSSITLQDSNGNTATVSVTLTVGGSGGGTGGQATGVQPSTLQLYWQTGTDSTLYLTRPDIVITGPSGNWSSSVSYAQGAGWLSLSPASGGTLPAQPTVIVNPTSLSPGTYSGTIAVSSPGGTQSVTVTLTVTSSPVLTARPGSVAFYKQTGSPNPQSQIVQFVTADPTLSTTLDLTNTVTANAAWISVSTVTKYITIAVDPTGLAGGVYSSSVTVSPAGFTAISVPVILVVDNGGSAVFTFSPASLTFSGTTGGTSNSQQILLTAAATTNYSIASDSAWLTANPLSGTTTPAGTYITVGINPGSLAAGIYNGNLTFSSGAGAPQNLPVTMTLTAGGGGGTSGNVTASPASFTFTAQAGKSNPQVQTISVTSAGGSAPVSFSITPTTTSGGNWLSTSAGSSFWQTPQTQIGVNVNISGLAGGTYQGNLHVAPTGGTAVDVPVTLTVTAPGISAAPASLTFSYRIGNDAPGAQQLTVSGNGGALPFTATASSTGNWLAVSPASGTTGATGTVPLNVTIDPTKITTTGTLTGTITVAGTATGTGSTTVTVTLTVTAPLLTVNKVTNAASYAQGTISPGEIVTLFGTGIGPVTAIGLQLDSTGKVATALGGLQVLINGYPAPLIYVSNTQISAVVPYEVAQFATANVLVKFLGQTSNGVAVNIATTAPGLFTQNASGSGPGAILNQNGSVNTPSNPAARGDTVVVYLTGEGQTSPAGVTGKVTTVSSTPPLTPGPLLPVAVTIGGQPANWFFAGEAPGFVSGVMQLNVIVPAAAGSGPQAIVVSIGGNSSQNGVTVSLQ